MLREYCDGVPEWCSNSITSIKVCYYYVSNNKEEYLLRVLMLGWLVSQQLNYCQQVRPHIIVLFVVI